MPSTLKESTLNTLPSNTAPPVITSKPEPSLKPDFFKSFDLLHEIETHPSERFTIDIQSDFRFPLYYSCYYSDNDLPNGFSDEFAYISTFSLTGYKLHLLYSTFLLTDILKRQPTSRHASSFTDLPRQSDLLNLTRKLHCPPDTGRLIYQIADTKDPARQNCHFTPTLAGFSFEHDFGRTLPTFILFIIHSKLAQIRRTTTITSFIHDVMTTTVITLNGNAYTIAQFLGDIFTDRRVTYHHSNWLNQFIRTLLTQVFGNTLYLKPTLSRIPLVPLTIPDLDLNPYNFVLNVHPQNLITLTNTLIEIDRFVVKRWPNAKTLDEYYAKSNGFSMLTHSIEPLTLPTWHIQPLAATDQDIEPTELNDTDYAHRMHFLHQAAQFNAALLPASYSQDDKSDSSSASSSSPTGTIPKTSDPSTTGPVIPPYYLVTGQAYNARRPPFHFEVFNEQMHVNPPVLWFQPRNRHDSVIGIATYLGIKIEQGNIDAAAIPLPNPNLSLIENNSEYLQGALPACLIKAVNLRTDQVYYRMNPRAIHTLKRQPQTIISKDMSRVVIPQFATTNQVSANPEPQAVTILPNFHDNRNGFTYTAFPSDSDEYPIPDKYTYLWSSYRYSDDTTSLVPSVWSYYTMRPFYGLCTLMQKSRNPVNLLPDLD